jgi:hypothetical protein
MAGSIRRRSTCSSPSRVRITTPVSASTSCGSTSGGAATSVGAPKVPASSPFSTL